MRRCSRKAEQASSPAGMSRNLGGGLAWAATHTALLVAAALGLSFVPQLQLAVPQLAALNEQALDAWALVAPGGAWHPAAFIEQKGHLVVEGCLLLVISYLLFQGTFRPSGTQEEEPLTEKASGLLCLPPAVLYSTQVACRDFCVHTYLAACIVVVHALGQCLSCFMHAWLQGCAA